MHKEEASPPPEVGSLWQTLLNVEEIEPSDADLQLPQKQAPGARFSKLPITFGPGKYFFELIYLSADGNYWRKLSHMLHEIIKVKI